jgi:hypothetical protein
LCPYRLICSNLLTGSFLGHQIYKTQSLWLIMISLVPYLDIHVAWPTEIGKWAHGFNGIYPWASFGPVYLRIVWAASEYALYYVKCEKMRYMNESIHIYCIYIYIIIYVIWYMITYYPLVIKDGKQVGNPKSVNGGSLYQRAKPSCCGASSPGCAWIRFLDHKGERVLIRS